MVGSLHHNNSCRANFRGEGWWLGPTNPFETYARSSSWRSSGENGVRYKWRMLVILGCDEDVRSMTLFPRKVKDVISAHCSYLKYQHVFEVKSCSTTLWYSRNGISTSLTGSTCSNGGFSSFPSMLEKTGVFHLEKPPTCPLVFFLEIIEPSEGGFSNSQPSS